ncbi:hypothetical protein TPHA_0F01930 [Tetrapisispora phaffii CBS 4417]|uniref:Uncharacterized protein n=1 Tax=Tetrapisispora phaffii (strain ATCC 24235 / CBS 4417 / NBRC 1672 / NRRL Y-8282 / UCD 70-5) TaxID=1071381 RepID=G8BV93_TETPH|nr:hypothetical protein TPHA_0F01930 [Tetrapisispora phaffii CBS 4417]CCE63675.1 hypothetical protein TPHA_0F01930 [Tetrapisispora phaffii CBS 4417]
MVEWTIVDEIRFFRWVSEFKPAGETKDSNVSAIVERMNNPQKFPVTLLQKDVVRNDKKFSADDIWNKLKQYYDITEMDKIENNKWGITYDNENDNIVKPVIANDSASTKSEREVILKQDQKESQLPWDEYGDLLVDNAQESNEVGINKESKDSVNDIEPARSTDVSNNQNEQSNITSEKVCNDKKEDKRIKDKTVSNDSVKLQDDTSEPLGSDDIEVPVVKKENTNKQAEEEKQIEKDESNINKDFEGADIEKIETEAVEEEVVEEQSEEKEAGEKVERKDTKIAEGEEVHTGTNEEVKGNTGNSEIEDEEISRKHEIESRNEDEVIPRVEPVTNEEDKITSEEIESKEKELKDDKASENAQKESITNEEPSLLEGTLNENNEEKVKAKQNADVKMGSEDNNELANGEMDIEAVKRVNPIKGIDTSNIIATDGDNNTVEEKSIPHTRRSVRVLRKERKHPVDENQTKAMDENSTEASKNTKDEKENDDEVKDSRDKSDNEKKNNTVSSEETEEVTKNNKDVSSDNIAEELQDNVVADERPLAKRTRHAFTVDTNKTKEAVSEHDTIAQEKSQKRKKGKVDQPPVASRSSTRVSARLRNKK